MDRGRRPGGSFPEPGADEEQPLGGERKVRPPLERALGDLLQSPTWPSCFPQLIPPPDTPTLSRTQPANLLPWMYDMPPKLSKRATRTKKHATTETHTHALRPQMFSDHYPLTISRFLPRQRVTSAVIYFDDAWCSYYMRTEIRRHIYATAGHDILSSFILFFVITRGFFKFFQTNSREQKTPFPVTDCKSSFHSFEPFSLI